MTTGRINQVTIASPGEPATGRGPPKGARRRDVSTCEGAREGRAPAQGTGPEPRAPARWQSAFPFPLPQEAQPPSTPRTRGSGGLGAYVPRRRTLHRQLQLCGVRCWPVVSRCSAGSIARGQPPTEPNQRHGGDGPEALPSCRQATLALNDEP